MEIGTFPLGLILILIGKRGRVKYKSASHRYKKIGLSQKVATAKKTLAACPQVASYSWKNRLDLPPPGTGGV
jgi:hypothetical protein